MFDALRIALTRRGLLVGTGALAASAAIPPILGPEVDDLFGSVVRLMETGAPFTAKRGPFTFMGQAFDYGFYRGVGIEMGDPQRKLVRHAIKVPLSMVHRDGPTEAAAEAINGLVQYVRGHPL